MPWPRPPGSIQTCPPWPTTRRFYAVALPLGRAQEFGKTTVRSAAGQPAAAVVSAVHDAVDAFRGSAPRGDDATVIVVRVLPATS